jgi:putative ABC transport system permease protein
LLVDNLRQDFALALRHVGRGGTVTAVAVLSLAIGIAANTTVFSVVHALAFPRLIYPDAGRLVFLESKNDARGLTGMMISAPDARDVAQTSRTLRGVSVVASQSSILRTSDVVRRVQGRRVDSRFFPLLQTQASLGRPLRDGDDQGVIVLSDPLWRSRFGADPAIVDRAITLDGGTVVVVGVMPPLFDGDADFWTPLGNALAGAPRNDRQYDVFARIAPDASLADANAELGGLSTRLAGEYASTNRGWQMYAIPLGELHGRDRRASFLLLQAVVACVLLIACANIANILLARGAGRRREIAVRVALGATRRRLVAALLTEAIVLAGAGGAIGVILSMWGIRAARTLLDFPDVIAPQLNTAVLVFSAVVTIATGVLCGVVPALRASSVAPERALREEGRGATDGSAGRFRSVLVVVQMACAVLLATSATLLVRSVVNRERMALGFQPRGAFRADLVLTPDRYPSPDRAAALVSRVIASVSLHPDVVAAGARTWALPTAAGALRTFTLPESGDGVSRGGSVEAVTAGYFDALGASLIAGRGITDGDRAGSMLVALVNEAMARRLWPGRPAQSALGRRVRLGAPAEPAPIVTVVGVVASVRRSPMHDTPVATVFVPYAQYPNGSVTIVVRTRGEITLGVNALNEAIRAADPSLLVEGVRTLQQDMAPFTKPLRVMTNVLGAFALTAVLLAALGMFSMMSYSVAERRHEIAVRAALGAARDTIVRMVLKRALRLVAAGVVIGMLAAAWATQALQSYLFGVTPLDPLTHVAVVVGLSVVAVAACWRPARLAASVDPMALLRR